METACPAMSTTRVAYDNVPAGKYFRPVKIHAHVMYIKRVACDNVSGQNNFLILDKSMPSKIAKIKENEIKTYKCTLHLMQQGKESSNSSQHGAPIGMPRYCNNTYSIHYKVQLVLR